MDSKGLDISLISSHPSPVRLAAFGLGKLDVDESSSIADHISGCDPCRSLVEAVGDDSLAGLFRRPDDRRRAGDPEEATRAGDGRAGPPSGYEVLEILGQGGMGVVYKARQVGLDRLVALKQLKPEALAGVDGMARFRREAEAAARLRHSNIVPIFDVGSREGIPFYAMEYVEGGTLGDRLADGPLDQETATRLARTLALAVDHAHEAGVVHRDLKPSNVLLAPDLDNPKIGDFGLAKLDDDATRTRSGVLLGTPNYMAPEQAEGDSSRVGPAADVYALGAILYEVLTGRPPFRAPTVLETLELVRKAEPDPPRRLRREISRDMETIALKCLEKSPGRRYASARALADDLHRHLNREPIAARPISKPERLAKWATRRPWQAFSAALGIVMLIVVVAGTLVANARLRAQILQTDLKAKEALAQQSRADNQYRSARDVIRQEIDLFDKPEYAERPLLNKLRRQQLEVALAFYEAVVREGEPADFLGRLDKVGTLRELARFQITLGRFDEALATLRRTLALLDDLAAERPDDPDVVVERGNVLVKLAIANLSTGRVDEAAAVYRQAIGRAERALRSNPDSLMVGEALAWPHDNLGSLLLQSGRLRESEPHFLEASKIRHRLLEAHPLVPDLKARLAMNLMNLGTNRMNLNEHDRAEPAFAEAEGLLKPLVKANPENYPWALSLGKLFLNSGTNKRFNPKAGTIRRIDQAIERYRAGLKPVEEVLRAVPDWPEARDVGWHLYVSLADTLDQAGRHREAVEPWDRAIELSEGELRSTFRAERAVTIAHAVDAAKAFAEVESMAREPTAWKGDDWYNLACAASVAARSFAGSGSLDRAEEAAGRALEWLKKEHDLDYFRNPDALVHLKEDADLEHLRPRREFKLILLDAAFPADPFRSSRR